MTLTLTYVQGPFPLKSGLPQTHHDTTVTNVESSGLYPSWEGRDPPILLLCPATEVTSATKRRPVPSLLGSSVEPSSGFSILILWVLKPQLYKIPYMPICSPAKAHVPWALKCCRLKFLKPSGNYKAVSTKKNIQTDFWPPPVSLSKGLFKELP